MEKRKNNVRWKNGKKRLNLANSSVKLPIKENWMLKYTKKIQNILIMVVIVLIIILFSAIMNNMI